MSLDADTLTVNSSMDLPTPDGTVVALFAARVFMLVLVDVGSSPWHSRFPFSVGI